MPEMLSLADLKHLMIGEPFYSRKNHVFKVDIDGRTCVAKIPGPGRELQVAHEYEILRRCRDLDVSVPEPIMRLESAFVMSYVDGHIASEVFDSYSEKPDTEPTRQCLEPLADRVASWLSSFHKAFDFEFVRGDSILRNFIDSPGGFVGLDLEESHRGDPVEDLGQVCAYILATRPMFVDSKFQFARMIAGRYIGLSRNDISNRLPGAISHALRYYGGFRRDHALMGEWAAKIKSWDEF